MLRELLGNNAPVSAMRVCLSAEQSPLGGRNLTTGMLPDARGPDHKGCVHEHPDAAINLSPIPSPGIRKSESQSEHGYQSSRSIDIPLYNLTKAGHPSRSQRVCLRESSRYPRRASYARISQVPDLKRPRKGTFPVSDNNAAVPQGDARSSSVSSFASQLSSTGSNASGSAWSLLLDDAELWDKFHTQQNEMIITKSGRCLFPLLRFRAINLDPDATYTFRLEFENLEPGRLRFSNGAWIPALSTRLSSDSSSDHGDLSSETLARESYTHPDLFKTGKHWMRNPISFAKAKLSNDFTELQARIQKSHSKSTGDAPKSSHLFHVLSFHKYRARVHLVQCSGQSRTPLSSATFAFDATTFIAVTHYQSHKVNDLKKGFNPHAKGFRDTIRSPVPSPSPRTQRRAQTDKENGTQLRKRARRLSSSDSSSEGGNNDDGDDTWGSDQDDGICFHRPLIDTSGFKRARGVVVATKRENAAILTQRSSRLRRINSTKTSVAKISVVKDTAATEAKKSDGTPGYCFSKKFSPAILESHRSLSFSESGKIEATVNEARAICAKKYRSTRPSSESSERQSGGHHYESLDERNCSLPSSLVTAADLSRIQAILAGTVPILTSEPFGYASGHIGASPASLSHVSDSSLSTLSSLRQTGPVAKETKIDLGDMAASSYLTNQPIGVASFLTQASTPTMSWYQQFSLLDQPSSNLVPLPLGDESLLGLSTQQDLAGTALHSTLSLPVSQQGVVQETLSDGQSYTIPPAHPIAQLTPLPSPISFGPFVDTMNRTMQDMPALRDTPFSSRNPSESTFGLGSGSGTLLQDVIPNVEQVQQIHGFKDPHSSTATILESKAFMSTSSVISLLPFTAYFGQEHLNRAIHENHCLKAFIRERYGCEAEADANAVVAMRYHR
ncbi:hypothetical protein BGZ99_009762 [Dissophora globulifera]|uniref:T-box domain-containing protein n=1 Tax=Dissophora globulifera TaxID=979702 RepID=A0A9P6R525_9FUNG|nr:hypothetical protein BGZ99_009762 [Dissophora globulifera]